MQTDVIIIGGGASGLVAAITAAKLGAKVIIIDHNKRIGQKLLATGNGKCNLTNTDQNAKNYRGDNPDFAKDVLALFTDKDTINFFNKLGLLVKDKQGYIYPISEQATTVLDILRLACDNLGVITYCQSSVISINKSDNIFILKYKNLAEDKVELVSAKKLILATGGKANAKTGSDGSGYELARNFGHHIIKPTPALVGLLGKENFFKAISGVRTEALLTLKINNENIISEKGELQLTNYGLSGIPVFQISRYASKAVDLKKEVVVVIDFLPNHSKSELIEHIKSQLYLNSYKNIEQQLFGLLNRKLASLILKQAGINLFTISSSISNLELDKIINLIKSFEVKIEKANTFDQAQVCAGGVDTNEVYANTLESKKIENLYIIGELLDIDGACGGYNLQWAWSTGYLAGKSAGERK